MRSPCEIEKMPETGPAPVRVLLIVRCRGNPVKVKARDCFYCTEL